MRSTWVGVKKRIQGSLSAERNVLVTTQSYLAAGAENESG